MSGRRLAFIILLIIGGIAVVSFYLGTILKTVYVTVDSPYEPELQATLETCLQPIYSRSYLFVSAEEIRELLEKCHPMVFNTKYTAKFPQKATITVTLVQPVVRYLEKDEDGGCALFETAEIFVSRDATACIRYAILPEIKGANLPHDSFRVDYTIFIVERASEYGITITTLEEEGDTLVTWYKGTLGTGATVYIPQGDEGTKKMASLAAALQGLESSGEKYQVIDLRFDRVVYR